MNLRKSLIILITVFALFFIFSLHACESQDNSDETPSSQTKGSTVISVTDSKTASSNTSGSTTTAPITTTTTAPVTTTTTAPATTTTTKPVTATTTKPVTTTTTKPVTTTTTKPVTTTTTKPVTTTTKPVVTTAPPVTGPLKGDPITVSYVSSDTTAGSISGSSEQIISYGVTKTTAVTAVPKLGYKFVRWSDNITTATRNAESPAENAILTAYFELDALELPILMITTSTGADVTSKDEYINGTIAVYNTDDAYLLDTLEMQIRGRGNYTWSSTFNSDPMYNKKAYRIKLSVKQKLCGVGEGKAKNWVLLADHCDQSLLRNNMVYTFAGTLSNILWQPSVQSVEVYLNGEYHGVYLLSEQVDVNSNKISVSEDISGSTVAFLAMYSGYANTSDFYGFSVGGQKYEIKSDLSENRPLAQTQKNYIVDYINRCWTAVNTGSESQISTLIDIDSVIDTYIVHELFKNLDTGWDNFYMSKDLDGLLRFGPVWDFDQCAGNADCDVDNYENIRGGNEQPWYRALLSCSWFKKRLQQRWYEIKAEKVDIIPGLIISTAESGYNSYCRNFDRWQIFGYKINRETYVRQFTTYKQHYEYFAEFMQKRIAWLDSYWGGITFAFNGDLTLQGSGTESKPYLINTADDFINFSLCLSGNRSFEGLYFLQTADIDLSVYNYYNGVGSSCSFAGIYDGDGHTINVAIKRSSSGDGDGCVFPYVTGTVMNVITTGTIENRGNTGGIARSVRTGGAIINCASYISLSSDANVGGIVASNQSNSTIANCNFGGSISSSSLGSPINVWYSGRSGRYINNYYAEGTPNATADVDIGQSESAVASVTDLLAESLNASLADAASGISGISVSDLNSWSTDNGRLILTEKE